MKRVRKRISLISMLSLLLIATMAVVAGQFGTSVTAGPSSFIFATSGDFNSDPWDSQTGPTLDRLQASGVSFLLALGDLGYTDDEQTWCTRAKQKFNNILVIVGNHDSDESGPSDISTTRIYCPFTLASQGVSLVACPGAPVDGYGYCYYFDYPATNPYARFFMVPWGNSGCTTEQISFCFPTLDLASTASPLGVWFTNAVNNAKAQGMWAIAAMHEDCISSSMRGCDMDQDYSDQVEFDIMIDLKVDLILTAHNHVYDRGKQIATGPSCPQVMVDSPGNPACVVDPDSPYRKDSGSIVVIQGTGGAGLYDVACGSTYFVASMSGATVCAGTGTGADGRGAVKYAVTPNSITAQTDFDSSYQDTFTIEACQTACPLSTFFTYSPTSVAIGTVVTFTAVTSGGTGPYTHTWDFGDGVLVSGESVKHAFPREGSYTVILTVTDSTGEAVSASQLVSVTVADSGLGPPPPLLPVANDVLTLAIVAAVSGTVGIFLGVIAVTTFKPRGRRREREVEPL